MNSLDFRITFTKYTCLEIQDSTSAGHPRGGAGTLKVLSFLSRCAEDCVVLQLRTFVLIGDSERVSIPDRKVHIRSEKDASAHKKNNENDCVFISSPADTTNSEVQSTWPVLCFELCEQSPDMQGLLLNLTNTSSFSCRYDCDV
jgi:hypothetical protein